MSFEASSDDPTFSVSGQAIHASFIPSAQEIGGNLVYTGGGVTAASSSIAGSIVPVTTGGITFNLMFDSAAMAAPASFRAGIEQAAAILSSTISDKITVNINIDYSGTGGGAAAGPDNGLFVNYSTVRSDLVNNATPGDTTFAALPTGSSVQGQSSVAVWNAQLKLMGLLSPNDTTTDDGSAYFSTDIDPSLLVGVALHELTHALGRIPFGPESDIFDLFRFTSPGVHLLSGNSTAPAAYFSLDGGVTKLADFGQTSDPSDFLNSGVQGANDPFNEFYSYSTSQGLTAVDKEILDALGFHTMPTPKPVLSVSNATATTGGQHIALSSLVTISDPGHAGYQKLELWDSKGTPAGGQFVVGGVAQTGGHEIDVAPGNVSSVVYDAGSGGGNDTLWAQLEYNDGSLSGWEQFSVTTPNPTLSVSNATATTGGQHIALSSLVTIADSAGVGYQTLELWDTKGTPSGGQFVVGGVAQTGGHEIDVSAANVSSVVFDAGSGGGSDLLWAQILYNDGSVSGWKSYTVTTPNPTLSVSNATATTGGQQISLSSLVSITDSAGVGYQKLELWDSNGTPTGGQFVVGGVAQTGGHEIDVAPGSVASTVFDAASGGGSDQLWAQILYNDGSVSGWKAFTVNTPEPTLSVSSVTGATGGQQISLASLVTIADPSHVGYQKLELWDSNGTPTGGQFVVGGVAQTGGHEIDVNPANVSSVVFDAASGGGNDTLWAQVQYNDGSLSGWKLFTVTAPEPTLSVSNLTGATGGQQISLASLVTIADPSHVSYQKLELWDSNGTPTGGQFVVGGVAQTGGHEIDVNPANVSSVVFDAASGGGGDTLWAQVQYNDGSLSGWKLFTVTAPEPTLSVSNASVADGQQVSLSSLVSIADPSHVGYQKLELWDSNGTPSGGQFVVGGVAQTAGHEIDVAPGSIAGTVFDAGTAGGSDTLWAQVQYNDGTLSGWKLFTVTAPQPALAVSSDLAATGGQHVSLSSLVTIADPSHIGYQKLELWDSNGTPSGGQFVVGGVAQTGGHEIDVSPGNVAGAVFDVGSAGTTDTLWAQVQYNDGSVSGWRQFSVAAPLPTLLVSSDQAATSGQQLSLSSLVTITDPASVGYQKLELWDSNGSSSGGQFVVGGVAQSGGHEIDVVPGNVAGTVFDVGTAGGSDTLWAQLQLGDGSLSGWKQFSVSVPVPTQPVSAVATADAFVFHQDAGPAPSLVADVIAPSSAHAGTGSLPGDAQVGHVDVAQVFEGTAPAHVDPHANVIDMLAHGFLFA